DRERAVVDLGRVVARVLVVEPEEAQVRRLAPWEALLRERETREADVAYLAVGAHLEPAVRRPDGEGRRVPRRRVPDAADAVEAPRHVREVERPHQPLADPLPLEQRERRVAGNRLEAIAVLEAADRGGEAALPERQVRELEEGLPLVGVVGMREIRGPGAEVADGSGKARVVGKADEARVLHLDDELHARQRDADPSPELASEEAVALGARGRRARRRTEPVRELAAEPLAERRRDVLRELDARRGRGAGEREDRGQGDTEVRRAG